MTKRRKNSKPLRWSFLAFMFASAFALPVHAQSSEGSSIPSEPKPQVGKDVPQSSHPSSPAPTPEASPQASAEEARQAEIEADTKKLYQLSAELRSEVAKTYKESLSVTVLKKAEEVEKLARSLKMLMNQEAAASRK